MSQSHRRGGSSITPSFISTVRELSRAVPLDQPQQQEIERVGRLYPFRIPSFYASLIDKGNPLCPIRLQSVPSLREIAPGGIPDPLDECNAAVTPSFLKRYPGRGVFLVSSECAMYCRFCNRKRYVGREHDWEESVEETFRYLEKGRDVSEVILSGGDPFMLAPERFAYLLERLRSIKSIEVIRVSTRFPVVYPEGVRREHLASIRKNSPVWLITHVNHPKELTASLAECVRLLRDAGALLVSQTVLLSRVNDCAPVLSALFRGLVRLGIKPYYLFQLDDVQGAQHFKVRVKSGTALMRQLRRDISGLAVPQYAVDITGGRGKVAVETSIVERKGEHLLLRTPSGATASYRDNGRVSRCMNCGLCRKELRRKA